MTATATVTTPAKRPRSRRWLRFAGPAIAVLLLAAVTITVHLIEQPDPKDPAFLSPASDAGVGARKLADRLTARGITIDRETTTPDALRAAAAEPGTTLFVPAPGLIYRGYVSQFDALPSTSRVVMVAPTGTTLGDLELKVGYSGPRWTTWAPDAGCDADWATGRAAVARYRYQALAGGLSDCYGGGVIEVDRGAAPFTFVGAADVFRNDRASEWANADVATALLARTRRIVWLDLHRAEPPPPQPPAETLAPPANPNGNGSPDDNRASGGGSGQSLTSLFPPAFWAVLALLALAGIALAAAAGRRVGAPVAEPLPVRVPSAETVRGLGDLYRRSKADESSLATIQVAARRRLADHLGVPPEDVPRHLPGIPPDQAERLLGDSEQDLATTAEAVQNLVRHIKGNVT
jgi:hypothetical protein